MNKFPLVIAHRGASNIAPENTLPAFQKAIELGCDAIELDVHLSRDGHVMVFHDNTLFRTTNGTGFINDYSLEELKSLDAGKHFSKQFAGTKIPTLEEVYKLVSSSNIKIISELKGDYAGLESKVVDLIHNFRFEDRAIVSTYNHRYLKNIKALDTNIQTELDIVWTFDDIVKKARELGVNVVCPIHYFVDQMKPRIIRKIKANNFSFFTYTVNYKEEMEDMIRKGVDGIMTNHPDTLIRLKEEYKIHNRSFVFQSLLRQTKQA